MGRLFREVGYYYNIFIKLNSYSFITITEYSLSNLLSQRCDNLLLISFYIHKTNS